MQKHAQWLSNRGYEQHLNVLRKIKERKSKGQTVQGPLILSSSPKKISKKIKNEAIKSNPLGFNNGIDHLQGSLSFESNQHFLGRISHQDQENESIMCPQKQWQGNQDNSIRKTHQLDPSIPFKQFTHSSLPMREQKILWDNYFLGKRIIETPPVICKRRLDLDYRKHQRLVKCLTSATNRRTLTTQFRLKKLQEYKQDVQKITDDRRVENTTHRRNVLALQIEDILLYRAKMQLQDVLLCIKFGAEGDTHRSRQTSEMVSSQNLTAYHFFFSAPKRHIDSNSPICIEVRNIKGLQQLSVGFFTFQLNLNRSCQRLRANLFHVGKLIGEVVINVAIGCKKDFINGEAFCSQSIEASDR